ncbi:MAG: metallopeptidase family protein [Dehalococcoidia bacterium]
MAVAELPSDIRPCLEEIDVVVSDIAEKSDLLGTDLEDEIDLLSLFEYVFTLSDRKFQSIVDMAVAELPDNLRPCLEEIDVVVSDIAEKSDLLGTDLEDEIDLLSLFENVPKSDTYQPDSVLRGQLTIFKMAIENICVDESEVSSQIAITLFEELGYHFSL